MDWAGLAHEFKPDGWLRDIYVLDATIDDWERVYATLARPEHGAAFFRKDEREPIPACAADAFEDRTEAWVLLTVEVGGMQLHCHFFNRHEIEFDLDPRDVEGQPQMAALSGFMTLLARTTGKPVILTHENLQEAVILRVPPG